MAFFGRSTVKKVSSPLLAAILASVTLSAPPAQAATLAQINTAIQAGIAHLVAVQNATTGAWNYQGYLSAGTGAAVFALLNARPNWPAASTAAYNTSVSKGIAYLLSDASLITVSTRSDGFNICPSGTGTCMGIIWPNQGEITYTTGIVAGAIGAYGLTQGATAVATNTGPLAGLTWRQIAQGITNAFAAAQSTIVNNAAYGYYGGWRYSLPANGDADSSTTQWAIFSFIFDESLGATTPASTKTILKVWLDSAQYAAGNGVNSGGICYTPPLSRSGCGIGPTVSDTGGWLLAEQWIGTPASDPKVQLAISWLNSNWKTNGVTSSYWLGNFNQPYAMLAAYKGLESNIGLNAITGINNLLDPTCGAPGSAPGSTCNWYQDYAQWLVANQSSADGSWTGTQSWLDPLSTAFDVTILASAVIPVNTPAVSVPAMSAIGLVIMAILLAGFAALKMRKQEARPTH